MKEHFLISDNLLIKAKKRWDTTDKQELDSSIIPALEMLNKHPNIATTWSCSGLFCDHNDDYDFTGSDGCYIIMAINKPEGIDYLFNLFYLISQEISTEVFPSLSFIYLDNFIEETKEHIPLIKLSFENINLDIINNLLNISQLLLEENKIIS